MLTSVVTACRSCLRGETRWRAGQSNLKAGARPLQHAWQFLATHFSQTAAVGPPALLPPQMRGPRVALMSLPGWASCLPPQATLLQIRWVAGNYWLNNYFPEQNSIIVTELAARLLPYKYCLTPYDASFWLHNIYTLLHALKNSKYGLMM